MTITVALDRKDVGPSAVVIDVGDPTGWSADEAREFVHTLQRLLGAGINSVRLENGGTATTIIVEGVNGKVTTPALTFSPAAELQVQRMTFDLQPLKAG